MVIIFIFVKKIMRFYLLFFLTFSIFLKINAQLYNYRYHWDSWELGASSSESFKTTKGIETDVDGNIYVCDNYLNKVIKFDKQGNHLFTFGSGVLLNPRNVAVSNSKVYVSTYNNITIFDNTGANIGTLGSSSFSGVTIDNSNNIFALNTDSMRVEVYSSEGNLITQWNLEDNDASLIDYPQDIGVDISNNVYVADYGNEKIHKYDPFGEYIDSISTHGNPSGIDVEEDGTIHVALKNESKIEKISSDGTSLMLWGEYGFSNGNLYYPSDVVVNSNGDIFVSNNQAYKAQIQFFEFCETQPHLSGIISGDTLVSPYSKNNVYTVSPVASAEGYTWTIPDGWEITSGAYTNSITVNVGDENSDGIISVFAYDSCSFGSELSLSVNSFCENPPAISGGISGDSTILCPNSGNHVYTVNPVPSADGYIWSVPWGWEITSGDSTNSIVVRAGYLGSYGEIKVAPYDSCGQGEFVSLSCKVESFNLDFTNGYDTVYPYSKNNVYTVSPVASAEGYTWTVPDGWEITSGENTNSITVNVLDENSDGYISVFAYSSCSQGYKRSKWVDSYCENPPVLSGTISGENLICPLTENLVYTINPLDSADGYNWHIPSGWQIISGENTNSITVNAGIGGTSGTIKVAPFDSCGQGPFVSLWCTIESPEVVLTESEMVCEKDTAIFFIESVYKTADWTGPGGYVTNASAIHVSQEGMYRVEAESPIGCIIKDSVEVKPLNYDCDYKRNLSWFWPGHKNWFIADANPTGYGSSSTTSFIVDMGNGEKTPVYNNDSPIILYEGGTCVSDDNGELLFFSPGRVLYDKNSQVAYSGLLAGSEGFSSWIASSSVQGIISVRHPLNPEKYYLFTIDDVIGHDEGLNYFTFDKEGKNIAPTGANRLGEFYTSEGIAATKHANGVDIWITVIELNSTNLRSYLLTSDGLDTNAVVSDVAPNLFGDAGRGGMAFSPDGSKLAVGTGLSWPQSNSRLIVYKFDNSTGNISERRNIWQALNGYAPYDVVFSPDGSKIIVSEQMGFISSYDISSWGTELEMSETYSRSNIATSFNALEFAANGYLYVSGGGYKGLRKIHGNYNEGAQNFTVTNEGDIKGSSGLPSMYLPPAETPYINPVDEMCKSDSLIDLSCSWFHTRTNAEDPEGTDQYSGVGIVDKVRGVFDPNVAGEGIWTISFQRNIGSKSFSDEIYIHVKNCFVTNAFDEIENNVFISPNPANDVLKVNSDYKMQGLSILNFSGQIIGSEVVSGNEAIISVDNLPAGIYFLNIQYEEGSRQVKFVKK